MGIELESGLGFIDTLNVVRWRDGYHVCDCCGR